MHSSPRRAFSRSISGEVQSPGDIFRSLPSVQPRDQTPAGPERPVSRLDGRSRVQDMVQDADSKKNPTPSGREFPLPAPRCIGWGRSGFGCSISTPKTLPTAQLPQPLWPPCQAAWPRIGPHRYQFSPPACPLFLKWTSGGRNDRSAIRRSRSSRRIFGNESIGHQNPISFWK